MVVAERLLNYKATRVRWDKKKGNANIKGKADVQFGHARGNFLQIVVVKSSYKNLVIALAAVAHDRKEQFEGYFICKGSHFA